MKTPTNQAPRTAEARVRRASARQGLTLHKNPVRDRHAIGYGTYSLKDAKGVTRASGLTLGAVETLLMKGMN